MSALLLDDLSNSLPEEDWQDTYSLGPKLGKGRSGVVRLAENVHTGVLLACKSISKEKLMKVRMRVGQPSSIRGQRPSRGPSVAPTTVTLF